MILLKKWGKNNENNIFRNNLNLIPKTEINSLVKDMEIGYIQLFDELYYKKNPRILKISDKRPKRGGTKVINKKEINCILLGNCSICRKFYRLFIPNDLLRI